MTAKPPRYFIYRTNPFRPLFHEHWFQEPRALREAVRKPAHIWWFLDRNLVRKMVREFNAVEPTQFSEESNYIRISKGADPLPHGKPARSEKLAKTGSIDDL
jgi:hypothetical protein